jgi:Cache domain
MSSSQGKRTSRTALWIAGVVFIILLIIPSLFGVFFYNNAETLSANAISNRKTIVGITATAVGVKLDHLVAIDTSMMADPQVVQDIDQNNWNGAADVLRDLQNNVNFYDSYIDRIVLLTATGTETAAYPELTGGIGDNFASSSWYQALSTSGASSIVSVVTKRTSLPQLNVVNVVVPILSGNTLVGYGALQIPIVNFLEFGSDASLGTFGFMFIVDNQGNIVAHPRYSSENQSIVNVSRVPVVEQVLAGNSGMQSVFSPVDDETVVSTYAPVPHYGWGVIAEEPSNEIFSGSDSIFFAMELMVGIFLVIDFGIAYLLFRFLSRRHEK